MPRLSCASKRRRTLPIRTMRISLNNLAVLETFVAFALLQTPPNGMQLARSTRNHGENMYRMAMPSRQLVCVDGTQQGGRTNCGPLTLGSNGGVHLHVIVDHSLVELIANNITAITASVAPSASAAGAALYGGGPGGAANVWSLAAAS